MEAMTNGKSVNGSLNDSSDFKATTSPMQLRNRILNDRGGRLETEGGTLYVSKPYRSKSSKKLRAMVAFAPRNSYFDLSNDASAKDDFRGFFTLFWISMLILTIRTYVISFEQTGEVLSLGFATMISQDAKMLALSDAVLVASTALFCVPYAKALQKGWLRYNAFGIIIQHLFQTTLLFTAIIWTFNRKWPWVQSGFLTLHSLVMIMKVHSYIAHNGHLSNLAYSFNEAEKALDKYTKEAGGWDKAVQLADASPQTKEHFDIASSKGGLGTPVLIPEGANKVFYDGVTPAALRKRLIVATESLPTQAGSIGSPGSPKEVHPLANHPDQRISELTRDLLEMQSELVSNGPAKVRWPENISWANYLDYLLVPSLVYDLEFPRTDRIRPLYIIEKTVATFGTFALLYTVTAHSILPQIPTQEQSFFKSLLDLSLPFMLSYLLLFYLIFECICNGFAEISRFADRQFYEDWWNATSWDEFARKWNKPVHMFLLRHVYASVITAHRLSRGWASFWTFMLSAAVHELVMIIVTKKFRMYIFMLQMAQLPLIALGRLPFIKKNKILGNVVFWIGLYAGFPLLCVGYCAY